MSKIKIVDNLPLSQRSRSGKSIQSNFSLDGNYAENDVIKLIEFPNIVTIPSGGGIIINASLFRQRVDTNVSDFPAIQLDLYEEADVLGLTEGDEYETGGGFNPIVHLPFVTIMFSNDYSQACARYSSDRVIYRCDPERILPTSFECEEKMKRIYGVMTCRDAAGLDLSTNAEKWAAQLSVSY